MNHGDELGEPRGCLRVVLILVLVVGICGSIYHRLTFVPPAVIYHDPWWKH